MMIAELGWEQIKLFLEHASGIERGTLHVLLGVLLQFTAALVFRQPVTRWGPWLIVVLLELVNEWTEFRIDRWPDGGMQYGEAAKDIMLTMVVPTLIMVAGRVKPDLLVGHASAGRVGALTPNCAEQQSH